MVELAPPTFPKIPGPVRGFVSTAPADVHSPMQVIVPSFSAEHAYELRRWQRRAETLPSVGDEVLVVEDEQGIPWGAAWWPQTAEPAAVEPFIPACVVYKAAGQTLAAAAFTELLFDTERVDNAGMHSTTTNTGRLVAPKSGLYLFTVTADYLVGASQIGGPLIVQKNGVDFASQRQGVEPNGEVNFTMAITMQMTGGEYASVLLYNSNAAAKTVGSISGTGPEASLVYLGTGSPRVAGVHDWGQVVALPSAATVGDFCSFKVRETEASPWKVWRLEKVEEAGTYPWAKIGGAPLYVEKAGTALENATNAYTYTGMPSLAIPLAMEADVIYSGLLTNRAAALNQMELQLVTGPTALTSTGAAAVGVPAYAIAPSNFIGGSEYGRYRGAFTKGNFAFLGFKSLSAQAGAVLSPTLAVDPTRVG